MKRKKAPLREAFFHLDKKNNVWRETVRFRSVSPVRSYDKQTSVYNEEDQSDETYGSLRLLHVQ